METIGKFCPVCNLKNDADLPICQYCGSSLNVARENAAVSRDRALETKSFENQIEDELVSRFEEAHIAFKGLAIYYNEPNPIAILQDPEFYIGRNMEETGERIIDLIPYDAFQMGVSRKHALVRQTEAGYEIIDEDSTNGTWVNGQQLRPNQPCPFLS